jgi:nucleoid DNA-binding protein
VLLDAGASVYNQACDLMSDLVKHQRKQLLAFRITAGRISMTKKELTQLIADKFDLPHRTVLDIVQRTFDGIIDTLANEGRIELRNFGVFRVKERRPRKARNPRTGHAVDVPKRLVVAFKPGREMQQRVGQLREMPGARAVSRTG